MRYSGVVQKGRGIAGGLGFPTVNIPLEDKNVSGIFAATVEFDGKVHPAAAYINEKRKLIEAHLLDFSGDLYDKDVSITLEKKIRENRTLPNNPVLRALITDDVAKVREYFTT